MAQADGWTPVAEPAGWTPVADFQQTNEKDAAGDAVVLNRSTLPGLLAHEQELEQQRTSAGAQIMPTVGGLVGGVVGGIPGAGIGGVLGDALRQVIQRGNQDPKAPQSLRKQATDMALSGAGQAAGQGAGELLTMGGSGLAKWLMNRATTRISAQLARDFPELTDTLIDNALTVSKGGYAKARTLLSGWKSVANKAVAAADTTGATIPVEMTPDLADSFKTALLEQAVKAKKVPALPGEPLSEAWKRLDAPTKTLFQAIDQAAEKGATFDVIPSHADLLKTQLQKESRALYLNRFAPNGPKAMGAEATVKAEFASRLNDAIDGVATGYKEANAGAQPLIGAVRGLKQAIRPSGNLYQAMVRPAVGAIMGGSAGEARGGHAGALAGAVAGAALTSPAGMSREAIILASPAMQAILRQVPKPVAQAITDFIVGHLPTLLQTTPVSAGADPGSGRSTP